jgi:gamma-glutamyltranspeptidase/glutathione hydrolase
MFLAVLFLVNNPEMAESVVDLPRFHQQYYPNVVEIEPDIFPQLLIESLGKKGHKVTSIGRKYGNMQLVIYDKKKNRSFAISDHRYAGYALSG